jgi:hypothetical protein
MGRGNDLILQFCLYFRCRFHLYIHLEVLVIEKYSTECGMKIKGLELNCQRIQVRISSTHDLALATIDTLLQLPPRFGLYIIGVGRS